MHHQLLLSLSSTSFRILFKQVRKVKISVPQTNCRAYPIHSFIPSQSVSQSVPADHGSKFRIHLGLGRYWSKKRFYFSFIFLSKYVIVFIQIVILLKMTQFLKVW